MPATMFVVSDGKFAPVPDFDPGNLDPEYLPVGNPMAENVGIVTFSVGRPELRPEELEAFARTGVSVPLVIMNDHCLGTIKSRQKARGFVEYGLDLHAVDFAAAARSCGLHGVTARTPEGFREQLGRAMEADRTTVIDARVDPEAYRDSFVPTTGMVPCRDLAICFAGFSSVGVAGASVALIPWRTGCASRSSSVQYASPVASTPTRRGTSR